jgi:hypothetical protein
VVERVERQPALGEEIGQRRLEEVVGEPVHVQHGAPHGLAVPGLAPHQHGVDFPLAVGVGAQVKDRLRVAVAQYVRLPLDSTHASSPSGTVHRQGRPGRGHRRQTFAG